MARGRALSVGLIEVDPDRYAGWPGIMHMCEKDARDMAQLLADQGIGCDTLLTAHATRAAVVAAIRSAARTLVAGDLFVLFYSGHGNVVRDEDGDEPSRSDQTWCLYDDQLIDDELYRLWGEFAAGTRVVVLSDSCYSGSIVRLAERKSGRRATGGLAKVMPSDIARKTYVADKARFDELIARAGAQDARAAIAARVLLISACADDAQAFEGTDNGVFTGALRQVWNNGRFTGSHAQLHAQLAGAIHNGQVPKLMQLGAAVPDLAAERALRI